MLIAQRPTLSEEVIAENRSRFTIEPLEPGFGYTLGNSLRRTLLSSIPGAATTSIRIEGVLHEFSTVPGVKEDVTEMILNLKGLVVSSEHDEPVVIYLRKQGPGAATAAVGPIAFVGLAVPHLTRAMVGGDHRRGLPVSILGGVLLLQLADVLGRVIAWPQEVGAGIVTAVVGAPVVAVGHRERHAADVIDEAGAAQRILLDDEEEQP